MNAASAKVPEWAKEGVPVWLEVRNDTNTEVYEFRPAFVKEVVGTMNSIKIHLINENKEETVRANLVHQRTLDPKIVRDLTSIPVLNDAEILKHLHVRYIAQEIYVFCGPSLIAVNPYKNIAHLSSRAMMMEILHATLRHDMEDPTPHVWSVSGQAFSAMQTRSFNQAICVNGESGAGKTESTKKCLEFLTLIEALGEEKNKSPLADKIMACNPILEAFGNAKTARNDNSSRFGKYVRLFFDASQKDRILGSSMDNYLLEKSRVVSLAKDERGYHIFYAMCRFMPRDLQKKYLLTPPDGSPCDLSSFAILRGSSLYEVAKINDREFYEDVVTGFQKLEFSEGQIDAIWRTLAAVLYLGNLSVDSSNYVEGQKPCKILDDRNWTNVLLLLGAKRDDLEEGLTVKVRTISGQTIKSPHKPEACKDFILSLAKELYNSQFNWLFKKLNETLIGDTLPRELLKGGTVNLPSSIRSIGLLDIFGFEIFEKNYIEQLFINYANERLQGLYIDHIFKNECLLFEKEGLGEYVKLITYVDNLGLIQSIDNRVAPFGIFPILNQMSLLNKKDENLMNEIRNLAKNKSPPYITFHRLKQEVFIVKHTARDVEYISDGFVEKNKDELTQGLIAAINTSHPEIVKIYNNLIEDKTADTSSAETSVPPNSKFLSFKFHKNMDELMTELHNCACHFIRCVKPNEVKKADTWVEYLVLRQVTYMGLLDSLKIRKNNYPIRYTHAEFYERYQDLDLSKEGAMSFAMLRAKFANFRVLCGQVLESLGIPYGPKDLLFGNTKVLLNESFKLALDKELKVKQKAKKEKLALIAAFFKAQLKRKDIEQYIRSEAKIIRLARDTLCNASAKFKNLRHKKTLMIIRKIQLAFKIQKQQRLASYRAHQMGSLSKYLKLFVFSQNVWALYRLTRLMKMFKDRIYFLKYKQIKKNSKKIVDDIFNKVWAKISEKLHGQSAERVQSVYRAMKLRSERRKDVVAIEENVRRRMAHAAATALQARIRGYLVRKRLAEVTGAAKKIQGWVRSVWLRQYFLKLKRVVVRLQRATRRFLLKKAAVDNGARDFFSRISTAAFSGGKDESAELLGLPFGDFRRLDTADLEYAAWLKSNVRFSPRAASFVPPPPEIELNPRAKLIVLPVDADVAIDAADSYESGWATSFRNGVASLHSKGERLLSVAVGGSATFIHGDEGSVVSFGAANEGQLCRPGVGGSYAQPPAKVAALSRNRPAQLGAKGQSFTAMTQSGALLVWGRVGSWRAGKKVCALNFEGFKPVAVAPQDKRIFAAVEDGRVAYWPADDEFQDAEKIPATGQREAATRVEPTRTHASRLIVAAQTRRLAPNPSLGYFSLGATEKAVSVSAGDSFLAILTARGVLFTLGENSHGQLGLGHRQSTTRPAMVSGLSGERVLEVSSGFAHVLCRSASGRVFVWGEGGGYQLFDSSRGDRSEPTKVDTSAFMARRGMGLKSIAAGFQSSFLLFEDHSLFGVGKLGCGTLTRPHRLPFETIFFDGRAGLDFAAVRISASWSRQVSLLTLTLLDCRDASSARPLKEKLASSLNERWKPQLCLPDLDEPLARHVDRKYFLRPTRAPRYVDLGPRQPKPPAAAAPFIPDPRLPRIGGSADGRPREHLVLTEIAFDSNGKLIAKAETELPARVFAAATARPTPLSPDTFFEQEIPSPPPREHHFEPTPPTFAEESFELPKRTNPSLVEPPMKKKGTLVADRAVDFGAVRILGENKTPEKPEPALFRQAKNGAASPRPTAGPLTPAEIRRVSERMIREFTNGGVIALDPYNLDHISPPTRLSKPHAPSISPVEPPTLSLKRKPSEKSPPIDQDEPILVRKVTTRTPERKQTDQGERKPSKKTSQPQSPLLDRKQTNRSSQNELPVMEKKPSVKISQPESPILEKKQSYKASLSDNIQIERKPIPKKSAADSIQIEQKLSFADIYQQDRKPSNKTSDQQPPAGDRKPNNRVSYQEPPFIDRKPSNQVFFQEPSAQERKPTNRVSYQEPPSLERKSSQQVSFQEPPTLERKSTNKVSYQEPPTLERKSTNKVSIQEPPSLERKPTNRVSYQEPPTLERKPTNRISYQEPPTLERKPSSSNPFTIQNNKPSFEMTESLQASPVLLSEVTHIKPVPPAPRVSKTPTRTSEAPRQSQSILDSKLIEEVDRIMRKPSARWTPVEQDIVKNYMKLTKPGSK